MAPYLLISNIMTKAKLNRYFFLSLYLGLGVFVSTFVFTWTAANAHETKIESEPIGEVLSQSALRAELSGDESFGDLLRLIKQAQLVNRMNESLVLAPEDIERIE